MNPKRLQPGAIHRGLFALLCLGFVSVGESIRVKDGFFPSQEGARYQDYVNETVGFSLTLPAGWTLAASRTGLDRDRQDYEFFPPESGVQDGPNFQKIRIQNEPSLDPLALSAAAAQYEKERLSIGRLYSTIEPRETQVIDGCPAETVFTVFRPDPGQGNPTYTRTTLLRYDGRTRSIEYSAGFYFRFRPTEYDVFKKILASYHAFGGKDHPQGMLPRPEPGMSINTSLPFEEALLERLMSQHRSLRETALKELPPHSESMMGALKTVFMGDHALRADYAADALVVLAKTPNAFKELGPFMWNFLTTNIYSPVNERAIDVLGSLGTPALPMLREQLKVNGYRDLAAQAIGRMAEAESLIPIFEADLKCSDPAIQAAAKEALQWIRTKGRAVAPPLMGDPIPMTVDEKDMSSTIKSVGTLLGVLVALLVLVFYISRRTS